MKERSLMEFVVGLFIIAGIFALLILAFKVSGVAFGDGDSYLVSAEFDNIGSLKLRAPVAIGGVSIGYVKNIQLDPQTFRAKVSLMISEKYKNLPEDTTAGIYTQGLLGANYVSLTPGFDPKFLKNGSVIHSTQPALILENLIGQLLFQVKDKKS